MINIKKLSIISALAVILIFSCTSPSFSQEDRFEVDYPEFGGEIIKAGEKDILPKYVKYIFNFAVGISGLIAFGSLVYGGSQYLISGDSPSAMNEAKDQIFSALLGIAILLSSYLILTTINPQLVILKAEYVKPGEVVFGPFEFPGVFLIGPNYDPSYDKAAIGIIGACVEENDCMRALSPKEKLGKLNNRVSRIKIVNKPGSTGQYKLVLHEDSEFKGNCELYTADRDSVLSGASSATVFQEEAGQSLRVTIYKETNYEGNDSFVFSGSTGSTLQPIPDGFKYEVRSLKMDGYGRVILRGNGKCEVLDHGVRDLTQSLHPIGRCAKSFIHKWFSLWTPCADEIGTFPTKY